MKPTSGPDFEQIDATIDRGASARRTAVTNEADPRFISPISAESRSRLHWFIGTSDITAQDPGSLTYEPHFGLREKPFSLSSDARFFYSYSSHGAAFDTLTAGIRRREGVLALMGEVGTGKTTLCRAVLQALDRRTFAAFVPDPFLSREDLLKTLLVDFGVVSVDEIRSGRLRGATRTDLSYPLYDFLASLQPLKAFAVVMIDEAHNLTTDLLEEVRILSDLEKNREKLLEVVLVGQPELQERLSSTEMRQLTQRVSVRCELVPLSPAEVKAYITHRLTVAGNDGRVKFTDQATECVSTASSGIPRVVNLICDRALLKAAWSGTSIVNAEHVVWAATDLQMPASSVAQPLVLPQAAAVQPPPADAEASPATVEEQTAPPPQAEAPAPALDLIRPVENADPAPEPTITTSAHVLAVAEATPDGEPRRRWVRLLAATAAFVLAASAGAWATRQWLTQATRQPSTVVAPPAPSETSTASAVASTTAAPIAPPAAEPAPAATPKLALQMATFQSSARTQQALQELRAAGYRAYSVELPPQDGERRVAVLIGPYIDEADAERDLETARLLPGYGGARAVQVVPPLGPADAQQ